MILIEEDCIKIEIESIVLIPGTCPEDAKFPTFKVTGALNGLPLMIDMGTNLFGDHQDWDIICGPDLRHLGREDEDPYWWVVDLVSDEIFKTDLYAMTVVMNS